MGLFFGHNKVEPPPEPNIKYGRLYNWYAINNANFAPIGWHVPTLLEVETMLTYIDPLYIPVVDINGTGVSDIAGALLKEANLDYWEDISGNTNEFGFNLRGSGMRTEIGSFFNVINEFDMVIADNVDLLANYTMSTYPYGNELYIWAYGKVYGLAVRLIKDDDVDPGSLTDLDGNIYRTCIIGNQVWLADNWACTKLNDGTPISNVTNDTTWSSLVTMAYCNYNNDINNVFL